MINYCSICGNKVRTYFSLDFEDLFGAYEKTYTQNVGLCDTCGFIFTQNPFTQKQLDDRYSSFSKVEYSTNDVHTDFNYTVQCRRQKNFISETIDLNEIESVFEVGAANGYNLSIYNSEKVKCSGVEPSSVNCAYAKESYGIDLFNGTFEQYLESGKNEKYDLVFLSMVLEHIVDPAKFISDCSEIDSKYIFIDVPTLEVKPVEEPMGMFCEEHVNIFTLDSLCELMFRKGFTLLAAENVYGLYSYLPAGLPSVMTLWKKEKSKKPMRMNYLSSEELLEKYIEVSKIGLKELDQRIDLIPDNMKLAVWGIGHHASMLLANTCLKNKNIVRVYDSDVRKHKNTFYDLPIVSFDRNDIDSDKVEGILLTTYTAQNAIMKYLEKLELKCKIYTLYDIIEQ